MNKEMNFGQPVKDPPKTVEEMVEEIVKNFETHFSEQYDKSDWKRLKSVRVQEPIGWLRENIYEALTSHTQAVREEAITAGRISVLRDFDAVTKADAFVGFTDDEWRAVQKFFRMNDEISGWKNSPRNPPTP